MLSVNQVFGGTGALSWAQECARGALIFAYGLVLVRLVGRRVFGKWAALDIVVSIVVGSNLSRAMTGNAPLWGTLVATTLLMLLHWALSRASAQSAWLSRIFEGRPIELSSNGAPTERVLRRHSVSETDLGEALRQAGLRNSSEADAITLEPSGKITVVKSS